MKVAPTVMRGRQRSVTYTYDDPEDPSKITGEVHSPDYTSDDWGLLLANYLAEKQEEEGESPCGHPIETAWNSDSDGHWKRVEYKCYACSAGQDEPVYHSRVYLELPDGVQLRPFEMDVTVERRQ